VGLLGVPHIYAGDDVSLFHAFGYAQMHSHANLLLRLFAKARGEAAAYGGAEYGGAEYLESDRSSNTVQHDPQP
jgi:acyl-homoserine-lactone acylase